VASAPEPPTTTQPSDGHLTLRATYSTNTFAHEGTAPRLLRGGVWALVGRGAAAFLAAALTAVVTRLVNPADAGVYFLTVSIVTVAAVVSPFGFQDAGVRVIAEALGRGQSGQAKRALILLLALGGGSAIIGGVGLEAGLPSLARGPLHCPTIVRFSVPISAWGVVLAIQSLISRAFQGISNIRESVIFSGLATNLLCVLACGLWLFSYHPATYGVVLDLSIASAVVSTALGGILVSKVIRSLEGPWTEYLTGRMARIALPLALTSCFSIVISQFDIWVVGVYRSSEDLAVYTAARRLALIGGAPLAALNVVLAPMIAELHSHNRLELERLLRGTAGLASMPVISLFVVSLLIGRRVLSYAFGQFYARGAGVLNLLLVGQLADVWTGSCGAVLVMTGYQDLFFMVSVLAGMLSAILNVALVTRAGIEGVAFASALCSAAQTFALLVCTRRATGLWTHASVQSSISLVTAFRTSMTKSLAAGH